MTIFIKSDDFFITSNEIFIKSTQIPINPEEIFINSDGRAIGLDEIFNAVAQKLPLRLEQPISRDGDLIGV